jgi:hypothetical protein
MTLRLNLPQPHHPAPSTPDFAEPVIGRAFARPVGSIRAMGCLKIESVEILLWAQKTSGSIDIEGDLPARGRKDRGEQKTLHNQRVCA